jgi:hypothetical protein
MPDPKLQSAMEEIKVILKKHDIAANVVLASPSHMEYLREICPSWACLKVEDSGIRIKALRKDYPDLGAWRKHVEVTVGMIAGFADALQNESEQMTTILVVIGKTGLSIDHFTREEPQGG